MYKMVTATLTEWNNDRCGFVDPFEVLITVIGDIIKIRAPKRIDLYMLIAILYGLASRYKECIPAHFHWNIVREEDQYGDYHDKYVACDLEGNSLGHASNYGSYMVGKIAPLWAIAEGMGTDYNARPVRIDGWDDWADSELRTITNMRLALDAGFCDMGALVVQGMENALHPANNIWTTLYTRFEESIDEFCEYHSVPSSIREYFYQVREKRDAQAESAKADSRVLLHVVEVHAVEDTDDCPF